jgi:hypothetical protein
MSIRAAARLELAFSPEILKIVSRFRGREEFFTLSPAGSLLPEPDASSRRAVSFRARAREVRPTASRVSYLPGRSVSTPNARWTLRNLSGGFDPLNFL